MLSPTPWSPFYSTYPSQMSFGAEVWQGDVSNLENRQEVVRR